MHDLVRARSQFIIATHSPIILAYPDAVIYRASEHGLEQVDYDDVENVSLTKSFLNRRQMFLEILLADDDAPRRRDDEEP